ncbi:MAG: ABC transporter ATP-binding protein, partial [Saprospiraceae bacterium]|nr:ABC transporter ATP-binding protein [Saprospiraceae bacterium]
VLAIVSAPVSMLRPLVVNIMVDDYIIQNDLPGLYNMTAVFIGVMLLTVALRYFLIYYSSLLGQLVIRDLRSKVFNQITSLQMRYFDKTAIGKSTTRTINDIETINTVFTQGIITMLADILGIFAALGLMFFASWKLTLLCLTTIPLMIIATYIFKEKVKVSYQKVRAELANMNAFLQERITGMRIIQIFSAEEQEMTKFKAINRKYTRANLDAINYYATFFPVVEIINYLTIAILVYIGARYVIDETVTLGALLVFPWYINLLFRPIRMLADKFNTLQMGLIASERVFNILDNRSVIRDTGKLKVNSLNGEVEFDDVTFAYDGENVVLHNVSFNVKAGETLAIVGSTGSGKTTIINILGRFYECKRGEIRIDNKKIQKYDLEFLRSRMAIVLQDVFLFQGSVMDNITLMDPKFTEKEVLFAAQQIGADKFIDKLPGGYDYQITERGANLSMGQRQLISFVRALVFDPDILILDEATSSIDTETEEIIQYAIEKLVSKRTSLIIAHRLSTIRHADNIMVLDKGNKIEFGNHDALLSIDGGRYRELYEMQFSEEPIRV